MPFSSSLWGRRPTGVSNSSGRWSTTSPSPHSLRPQTFDRLIALSCPSCGTPLGSEPGLGHPERAESALQGASDEVEVFSCAGCRRAWRVSGASLNEVPAATAAVTSRVPGGEVLYLPVWRFRADAAVTAKRSRSVLSSAALWEGIRRSAGGAAPHLYVPSFTLHRTVVRQLGVGLLRRQPQLELRGGAPDVTPTSRLYPVVLSGADAATVAHFVYLAAESDSTPDLRGIDYELRLGRAELVFLPADYDVRYVRDSNWRFLLQEFDSLVT